MSVYFFGRSASPKQVLLSRLSLPTTSRLLSAPTRATISMSVQSTMSGSDGPPSWASWSKHARSKAPHQPHSPGRSHLAGGYDQRGEREPLLGGRSDIGTESLSKSPGTIPRIVVYCLFAFFAIVFMSLGYNLNSFINSRYYEAIRQGWAHEVAKHQALRLEMNHDEAIWEEKRAEHKEQERQRQDDENKRWETIRQGWATEVAKHQALRLKMNQDEADWEERRAKREEQERKRHEDEIKKREGISWEGLTAARCSRYATREYTALLSHIPLGFDAMEECRKKSINIHGRDLLPSRCEDQGACGRVTGHWDVDFDEPGCVTWWHWFDDKGCYSSGIRLYHSKLENLEHYDLWPVMCSTTPREVNGVHYDGPTSCADFGQGPWGIWHIPDESCP